MKNNLFILFICVIGFPLFAQENTNHSKFRQLYDELPTPNAYRTGSGAPGHAYYQQQADYNIHLELNDNNQSISGEETITYYNNSPDPLNYLWVQLDQNVRAKDSDSYKVKTSEITDKMSFAELRKLDKKFDGGFNITHVKDINGNDLQILINRTMMRVDLPQVLKPGTQFQFNIKWDYRIQNRADWGGRSGYEYFEEDNNYLYVVAQFYPRMALYDDIEGWQNKQFLGNGEFTLSFGDFEVHITVPADHLIAATGELQNSKNVLTSTQRKRLKKAKNSTKEPVLIVTQAEAEAAEKTKSTKKKTWIFKAKNVRDFGFASSRRFIWDAMAVKFGNRTSMAMSMYPKEGNPLWEKYSTRIVAHTLSSYSKHTFDYPYPVAWSIHTNRIGMEYPMICFNGGRPEADGTYSLGIKSRMISVIIHEVGHNYFPMIVNSDERQWTWMDEGLNTFTQQMAEFEWDANYPSWAGQPSKIVEYMKMEKEKLSPIMTNSESILNFGPNAYMKPATALFILRETIMGRELFDKAYKEYATRWMFKHPSPADFFRTMEDASGTDLDWFWRGWFFTTDNVDIALAEVKWFQIDTKNPAIEKALAAKQKKEAPEYIGDTRNKDTQTVVKMDKSMKDFYNKYDPLAVTILDKKDYQQYIGDLTQEDKNLLNSNTNYYSIRFKNIGGLVMPIILEFKFQDGSSEIIKIPAEIWRKNNETVNKVFSFTKEVSEIILDPRVETADVNRNNNYWPPKQEPSRFEIFKEKTLSPKPNPMQDAKKIKNMDK